MSKQDRQGVRTPSDVERKYNLGDVRTKTNQQSEKMSQYNQTFAQFINTVNAKIASFEAIINAYGGVGAVHISTVNTNPSTIFGGTWELLSSGYIIAGLDQENENDPSELKYIEYCYIWKRTA